MPPAHLFPKKEDKKEAPEHLKHVTQICPNIGNIFQNELRNTWAAILKILTI